MHPGRLFDVYKHANIVPLLLYFCLKSHISMILHSRFCLAGWSCGCCCSVLVYCTRTRVTVALNRGPTGMATTAYPLPQNYTMKWPGTEDDLVQTSGKVPPWFHQREYTLRNLSYYESLWFHHHANGTLISNTPFPTPPHLHQPLPPSFQEPT